MKFHPQSIFVAAISRRDFLKGAASVGALTAASPLAFSAEQGVLKAATYTDLLTLDPAYYTSVVDESIMAPIYRKLIQYKPGRKWEWQLDAAAAIEQVDATHIKFALRDDIGFADGFGAMTAEDVKFSFERIINPETESSIKPDWGPLSHVEVIDDRSGVIVFNEPFSPVWNITLPYGAGNIVSKKAVEAAGGRLGTESVAVSGPYRLKEWRQKQRIVLERNPDWRGPAPDFDEIQIFPIDDEKTSEIAFAAGDVDFTRVSLASLQNLKSNPPAGSVVEEFPSLFYVWVGMNLDNSKLQNKKLRQAIQAAIDVPSIMEASYFGSAKPSTGIIAPGLIGHREKSIVAAAADFEKARQLLEESGVGEGYEVTLDVLNKTANVTTAQIIQSNLSQIGLGVKINLHESGAFWTLGAENSGERWKEVELILNRFSMTPDPYYATSWFISEQVGIWNWERFRNEEFDRLHEAAKGEINPGKRGEMYRRMQDIMEESGAYRFITHEASPVIYRNDIKPALRPDGLPLYRYFKKA